MQDIIFLNFYGVGTLSGVTFFLLAGIFLLAVPEKSRATLHLGLAFLFAAMLAIPYIPATIVYHPYAAYHRWMTVPAVYLCFTHYGQFLYQFPRPLAPRVARIMFIIQYLGLAAITAYFIQATAGAAVVYEFSGHFYDFDADRLSALVGAIMFVYIIHTLVVGVAQIVTGASGQRLPVFFILLAIAVSMVLPGITNVMSRDGLMAREFHQTFITLLSVTGYFFIFILYINNSNERTTFMAKIVGVSLVVFLVMFVVIAFAIFSDREQAYALLQKERTGRLVADHDAVPEDLEYLLRYDTRSTQTQLLRGADASVPDFNTYAPEYENAALYARIAALDPAAFPASLDALLADSPAEFAGYAAWLRENAAGPEIRAPVDLLAAAAKLERPLLYRANKLRRLPPGDVRASFKQSLAGLDGNLEPFARVFGEFLATHPNLEGAALRQALLRYLAPFQPPGVTRFRALGDGSRHFVSFLNYDERAGVVYEAGYDYRSYRRWVHPLGVKLLFVLGGAILTILCFRFFFQGTLVTPLRTLVRSVHRVNKGDLTVNVPVRTEDEIGFLTRSFNGMVESIRVARDELQRYAGDLEDKVAERTRELQRTLETVQELKERQDGDYFLTSLILKPLAANNVQSETIRVDFLIEQMKKFEFRHWREEIGGDICSAHTIYLKERPCTVFLNADAMGKSIQGAGGALVLGAVFESIIERTHLSSAMRDQYPERWLKNAFVELQKVFESFDGSMLVSMVMGLVDDGAGLLYFVNAEHPYTVLYRDGKASFIDDRHTIFRKLGITDLDNQILIQTLRLQPGDVLLAGSDGRDDLVLERKGDRRVINEDETLFLSAVERSNGALDAIYRRLREAGEFSDDFSLVRISYMENTYSAPDARESEVEEILARAQKLAGQRHLPEAEAELKKALDLIPAHRRALKALVRLYMKQRAYDAAAPHVREYIARSPFDTEVIYFASYIARQHRNYPEAADLGERVRLRAPTLLRNLVNLAEVYARMGNSARAAKLLEEIFVIEPDHSRATKLRAALAGRRRS